MAKMKEKGKTYKQFIAKVQKSHNKKLHKNLRKYKKLHPKDYWEILKKEERLGKKESKVPLSVFEKHFKKLNQNIDQHFENMTAEANDSFNQEINADFTLEELNKNLKLLNNKKAAGIDLIKNEFLKNSPPSVITLALQ